MQPISQQVQALDDALYDTVQGINILSAVAPLNFQQAKSAFFESKFTQNPEFVYTDTRLDCFERKRKLFNLPIDSLGDEDLVTFYKDVIESYVDKIDQFNSVGTPNFVYNCLRYYGEPNQKDIANAKFLLHLPGELDELEQEPLNAEAVVSLMGDFANQHGYEHQILIDDSMIANALVTGTTIKVNTNAKIPLVEAQALAHHEIGVHLVTTLNSRAQPIRALNLGSPLNTMTQEGIAILCEYLAGCVSLPRLKVLALRVLAVDSMLKDSDFKRTFTMLLEQYRVDPNLAFTITARAYRGGGFTKDYLYLQGLHNMLNAYENEPNFNYLLAGKVSLEHLPLITRLIDKGFLSAPKHISPAILNPVKNDKISEFISHAIR